MRKSTNFLWLMVIAITILIPSVSTGNTNLPDNGAPYNNPPCELPAPVQVSWGYPTPFLVTFNWGGIGGAAGYQIELTDLNTNTTSTHTTAATTITLSRNPAHDYKATFTSICPNGLLSHHNSTFAILSNVIVFDILAENSSGQCKNPTLVGTIPSPINTSVENHFVNFAEEIGAEYIINYTLGNEIFKVFFRRNEDAPNEPKFSLQRISNYSLNCTSGQGTDEACKDATLDVNGFTSHIIFPLTTRIIVQNNGNGESEYFDNISVYKCSTGYNGSGGSSHKQQPTKPDVPNLGGYVSLLNNPVTETLSFSINTAEAEKNAWYRLIGFNGEIYYEQLFSEGLYAGSQIGMNTAFLPAGIYFLQVQVGDLPAETLKVVKQ